MSDRLPPNVGFDAPDDLHEVAHPRPCAVCLGPTTLTSRLRHEWEGLSAFVECACIDDDCPSSVYFSMPLETFLQGLSDQPFEVHVLLEGGDADG